MDRIEISDEHLAALESLGDCNVLDLLEDLPEDQCEAVRRRIIEELDYSEFAASAQISPAAARKRVSRGLSRLR